METYVNEGRQVEGDESNGLPLLDRSFIFLFISLNEKVLLHPHKDQQPDDLSARSQADVQLIAAGLDKRVGPM